MEAVNAYKKDIILLLVENGANMNAQDNRGCTTLMRGAYIGYPELVKYLLEHGADKEILDNEGNKAIHYVRKENFEDLKDLLK
jgi:ankyrin repeat protein